MSALILPCAEGAYSERPGPRALLGLEILGVRWIGKGAFGEVWRLDFERPTAIRGNVRAERWGLKRWYGSEQETKAIAALAAHCRENDACGPGLMRGYDIWREDSGFWSVYEWIEGEPLESHMRSGAPYLRSNRVRSPTAVTATISSMLHEAAKWAKMANGHGDIRPTNILIQNGDFGPTVQFIDPLVSGWSPLHARTIPDRCALDVRRLAAISGLLESWLDSGEWQHMPEETSSWS